MAELNPDMQTIIDATEWLTTSPDTHQGYPYGRNYVVDEMATTDDGSKLSPQGVYFGHTDVYTADGRKQTSGSVKLINHGDRASYHDHVPMTYAPTENDKPMWRDAREGIDMRQLGLYDQEKLSRMATNARLVLQHYGVEIS